MQSSISVSSAPPPTGGEPVGRGGVVYQRNEVSHSLGISQTPGLSRGDPPSYRVSTLFPGFPRFPIFQIFMLQLFQLGLPPFPLIFTLFHSLHVSQFSKAFSTLPMRNLFYKRVSYSLPGFPLFPLFDPPA
jgi:hypothetical protein